MDDLLKETLLLAENNLGLINSFPVFGLLIYR